MKRIWLIFAIALVMIAGTAVALVKLKGREKLGSAGVKLGVGEVEFPDGTVTRTNIVALPDVAHYESRPVPVSKVELESLPKDTTFGRKYYTAPDDFECFVSVVLMGSDRTSIHPPQYCLVGQGWNIDSSEQTTVPMESPCHYNLPVMKLTTTKQFENSSGQKVPRRGVFVYWFVADQQFTAQHSERMLNMAMKRLRTGVLDRWAYIAYFSTCAPGQEEATFRRMQEFIAASVPEFQLPSGCTNAGVAAR